MVDFTRTTSQPPLMVGEYLFCQVLLFPIYFIFRALLSRSHPPSSVSDPGSHRKLSSLICRRFLYSKAIEGCNRIWVLRRWYIHSRSGFFSPSAIDYPSHEIEHEQLSKPQIARCMPTAWVCSSDFVIIMCQNQPFSAVGERYTDPPVRSSKR